jgi:signal transduction histidine kinase
MVLDEPFLRELGHEARGPIATVRSVVMTLNQVPDIAEADRAEFLGILDRESVRLGALVEDLLCLVRIGAGLPAMEDGTADLVAAVGAAWTALEPIALDSGIGLDAKLPADPVRIPTTQGLSELLASRLLGAALRVAPSDSRIQVNLTVEGGRAVLRVACRDLPLIAARALSSRVKAAAEVTAWRSVPEAGLGLALVRALVDAQGGGMVLDEPAQAVELWWPTCGAATGSSARS